MMMEGRSCSITWKPNNHRLSPTSRSPGNGGEQGGGAPEDWCGVQREKLVTTEQADTVAVSARFFHGNQGEAIGNVFGAVDEIVDLCHGAREQNHHAIEARKRALELEARERVDPIDADGHEHPAVDEEAVDTASGGESADGSGKQVYKDEGDRGGEDLTSESDDACLPTEIDQGTTVTRKTRDKGDSHNMDRTFASGQDKK